TVAHTLDEVARELARRVADLSQDRARIDAIVAGMVEGVLVVDHEGRIQRINTAAKQLLGIGDIALGQPFSSALKDPAITEQLSGALKGEGEVARELPLQRDSSRTIVARASAVPTDRGGGAVLVLHDISDIRRADRMRQDFVANVSHELRTPLTVIRGYAEALADGSAGPGDVVEFGSVITRHATKMERLVADLLRLARLDAQQETLSLGPCDIERIFAGVVQDLRPLVDSKRQNVAILVAPGAGATVADAAKMHDVLRNLVDNAVTYAPEGAEIRLEAWASDGIARLTVADNGPGIPSESLPRIFERFYRVDPSRARPGGTGLGLAIVKHLVELHGGSVTAANSALGGAVFTVVLPSRIPTAVGSRA
ncbi:MAG TPA: ATP-binding protein, partial [Vicinamibacterales bacterium]